ncbi:MAG: bifunctional 2-polyprenyl-6-hydroxyphenol methylase/3-demethylubiquinol 3-O-methyltransferase UbiG [Pseudomonadota bacterium]|nr:bifunctional 2-polyprenyl-6-hydroxyphenol methylase/3-demethylubiquinol 3-O-methyltransferase UbiG [Pseudomonadota bacterium]
MAIKQGTTIDKDEVDQFSSLADEWWNPKGKFKPLHKFNPIRLAYIRDFLCMHFDRDPRSALPLNGLNILDVGCGGGLIAEPLARLGASVSGIDASSQNIEIAAAHAERSGVNIDYRAITPEELARSGQKFDVVVALEVVEHVRDINLFLEACSMMTGSEGTIILATLNRTPKSFLLGIVGAEYIMRWLPRGTHDWHKFIRPSEIARVLRRNNIEVNDIAGLTFNPITHLWRLSEDVSVNYIMAGVR